VEASIVRLKIQELVMKQLRLARLVSVLAVAAIGSLSMDVAWSKAFRNSGSDCVLAVNNSCVIANPNKG
jgi:hypothetical protein